MRLPRFSPAAAHRAALASLVLLAFIVFTGAAVRLSGSGLACPNWPECNDQVITANQPEWIEFGNRLISGAVGAIAIAVFFMMWRRNPRDRMLLRLSAIPAVGVAAQGGLGALTVEYELKPTFVMAHFLLSFLILIGASLLVWRSNHPAGSRPRTLHADRWSVWAVRALLPLVTLIVVIGTFATGAGPHPGSRATGEVTERIDWFGPDTLHTLILRHGHVGTFTFIVTFLVLAFLWKRGAPQRLQRKIAALLVVYALQGAVGLFQYYNGLPAELVWVHIVLATCVWILVLFAVFEAGKVEKAPQPERLEKSLA
ncbi:MAG: COX15/CtaA family protein [Solirubrobacteraceae bacterium]|nr:COX15/CtaA family protein [Solirubrobacteraceae bacterium]